MSAIPKLIAFDLDGTLAASKQPLTPQMGAVIEKLLERIPVAVMSGAGFPQFQKQFLSSLPASAHLERLYLFPTNAAQCYIYAGGAWRPRYDQKFSPEEREKIMTALDESMKETGFDQPPPQVWGERIEDRGAQITFSHFGQEAPLDVKGPWDPTREKRKPLYEALLKRLPEFSIGLNATNSIDITRKGINKAYGIECLPGLTGIAIADMLYVGDALFPGGNDSVVEASGVPTHAVSNPEDTARYLTELLIPLTQSPASSINKRRTSNHMETKDWIIAILVVIVLAAAAFIVFNTVKAPTPATNTAPSSTATSSQTATTSAPQTPVTIAVPASGSVVTSPLTIQGEALGTWFFEAQFPVKLKDGNGKVIANAPANAQGDWMTENFVPFATTLTFTKPETATGTLILQKDNPSGDPAREEEIDIPVRFQ